MEDSEQNRVVHWLHFNEPSLHYSIAFAAQIVEIILWENVLNFNK